MTEKGDLRIKWTETWGSSLADFKDTFETVEDNIAQMTITLNVFEQANLPLENLSYKVLFATGNVKLLNKVHQYLPELLIICLVTMVLLGTILDSGSIMLILVPLAFPILQSFGVDLIWFGIVTIIGVKIGLLTHPSASRSLSSKTI